ncbi:MAG: TetR family transcriptional regulator [Actinobacteria bacterium]|nr:TetR family transcriptional regulator [Actinomycetota bacterium]
MSEPPARPVGLRERKKARTRAAIRQHALRLIREQGYHETTIEQIADAAEVSPATFFRYFPTKEDVVLQDDIDVISLEAMERQPPELGPIAAFRAAIPAGLAAMSPDDLARFVETSELMFAIPEIRARALDEYARTIHRVAEAIARRTGRSAADLEVRTIAGAIIGVITSVVMPVSSDIWTAEEMSDVPDLFERIDQGLEFLERGLPL